MNHEEITITVSLISTVNMLDPEKKIINVPYIRVEGKWLERLGFNKGDNVAVIGGGNNSELRLRVVKAH